jgi:glycosyltransferase involved in cell wall biosynthesis
MFTDLVSVRLMTYNHARFIRQAMDGIFAQQTTFPVEIVVGDDFSSDTTLDIIKTYKSTEQITVRILDRVQGDAYWTKRQEYGRFYNFIDIVNHCKGKYTAILDGDDYWTDPHKLQKQVDYLEKHPSCVVCCGGFESWNDVTGERNIVLKEMNASGSEEGFEFSLMDTSNQWLTKTLSTVFRTELFNEADYAPFKFARDIHFFYLLLKKGNGYYFKQVFGVYRIHEGGINSLKQGAVNTKAAYKCYTELFRYHPDKFTWIMARRSALRYWRMQLRLLPKYIKNR